MYLKFDESEIENFNAIRCSDKGRAYIITNLYKAAILHLKLLKDILHAGNTKRNKSNALEQSLMDPVRFTFSRRQESYHSRQVTPASEEKKRKQEREGDNKTTAANSYRFEILRNKVYIGRAVLDIMVLASCTTSSSLVVPHAGKMNR